MADLVTRSRLDDSGFNRGLAKMRSEARAFNKQLSSEFSKVFSGAAMGGGIAASAYGIGAAIKGAFADADRVSDLAETLREMPADLVRVGGAAVLMGADMEAVVKAAVKLRVNLGKAAEGGKAQADALAAMGLNGRELSQMNLPDLMVALSEGYGRAEKGGAGFLAVQELLSRGGTELINLLQRSPAELKALFESIQPASDAALMGMGVLADQWNLMLQNMRSGFQQFVWDTYAGWRRFKASLQASEAVGKATRERFAKEKDSGIIPEGLGKKQRRAAEGALYKKIHGEEMAKWMGSNPEEAGFMTEGRDYRPKGPIDLKKGATTGEGGGGDDEKKRKEVDRLTEAYWKAKEARDAANRTDEQNLENLIGNLAELRSRIARGNADQAQSLRLRTEEQALMKEIEDLGRKIGEQKKRDAEEDKREKEKLDKLREDRMSEAAKQREYALEAAILQLKSDGKEHAAEEARLRLAAAEKEYDFARGSKKEAEAYVALMAARNNLSDAVKGDKGNKDERIKAYMTDGMSRGDAKKKVREEMKQEAKNQRAVDAYDRSVARKGRPSLIDNANRPLSDDPTNNQRMDLTAKEQIDVRPGDSELYGLKKWEQIGASPKGSGMDAETGDAAAGKGIEGASGGDSNGIGQLIQVVNELKQAIEKASGGS